MKTMRFLLAAMLTLSPALASGQTTASASDAGTWSGPVGNLETFSRTAMIDSDGSVAGYAQNLYLYDSKARPVKRTTAYPDGGILREELTYNFPGEVTMSAVTYSRDLPSRISSGGSVSVKYSYLADGTKTSSLTESGEGLVYRGPFTYRRSADGSLALESVVCAEGRLTPERALLYVRDHLGSVRSVVDGVSGAELENSDYSAYGTRTALPAPHDAGVSSISLRDHFTGQEDQMPDFNVPYSDHGARLYSPDIRRWLTPDPLSEKYYGLSVYGYCAGNPVNAVDLDGRIFETLWDIANVTMDIHSLIQNVKDGNVISAVIDGAALVVDGVAAVVPFIPGGLGAIVKGVRGADKAVDVMNIVDAAADVNKAADAVEDAGKIVRSSKYGSYTITFESGMKYHGKGPQSRMEQSARKQSIDHTDKVVSKEWTPSASEPEAFMDEARRIRKDGGIQKNGGNNYNQINSPGEKMLKQKGE